MDDQNEVPWTPEEMAELMESLARSADRNTSSYSETAHLSRNAALTIRNLLEALQKIADMPPCLLPSQLIDTFIDMRLAARAAIDTGTARPTSQR